MKISQFNRSFVICAILMVIAYSLHPSLISVTIRELDIVVQQTSMQAPILNHSIIFAITFLLIPLAQLLIEKTNTLHKTPNILWLIVLSVSCGCIFWWLRLIYLKSVLSKFVLPENLLSNTISFNELKFELYFSLGLLLGLLISWIVLKIMKK